MSHGALGYRALVQPADTGPAVVMACGLGQADPQVAEKFLARTAALSALGSPDGVADR